MPEIKDVELNQSAYALTEYVSEWVNVTSAAYTTFAVYCSGACNAEIEFSFDTLTVEDAKIEPVLAGETISIIEPISTPFQRFKVTGISPPQDLKLQGYFFQDELGANSTTLSSAGGTFSLVNGGSGPALVNKGLTPGTGITISDSGTALTINASGIVSTVWQEASGLISPITASTNGILCGNRTLHTLINSTESVIVGGSSSQIIDFASRCAVVGGTGHEIDSCKDVFIGGGINNRIDGDPAGGCGIIGGENNTIEGNTANNNIITGGASNTIFRAVDSVISGGTLNLIRDNTIRCAVVGGTGHEIGISEDAFIGGGRNNRIDGGLVDRCAIIGGDLNIIEGNTSNNSVITGGTSNTIFRAIDSVISGGTLNLIHDNTIRSVVVGGTGHEIDSCTDAFIGGGSNNRIDSNGLAERNAIIGGENNTIEGDTSNNSVILGGNDATISSKSNVFMFSHGSAFSAPADNSFIVKTANGAQFYSNDTATAGVTLAAGANAWAMVSDENKKENLIELNHHETIEKVGQIPVYRYNFIGSDPGLVNIGPVAQDWNKHFGTGDIEVPVLDEKGEEKKDPETGEIITETKPAKDPLYIDQGDVLGVLLSCVKELNSQNKELREKNISLEQRIQILEDKIG